jgi:hypothetical protein
MFHLDKPFRAVGCASARGCRITASDNSPLPPKPDESLSCRCMVWLPHLSQIALAKDRCNVDPLEGPLSCTW